MSAAATLTDAQRQALLAEGDVLVRAAAGSGKTRVLTARIVRAAIEQDIPLGSIVAVTFTEKAAQEIRERVAHELQGHGRSDLVSQLEHSPIGTIHSLCGRLLRDFGAAAGIDPGFRVLDGAQAAWLRSRAVEEAIEATGPAGPEGLGVRVRYGDGRLAEYVHAALEAAGQRLDQRVSFGQQEAPAADARFMQALFDDACARYDDAKRAAGGLDFDDLQHHALRLLDDDSVLTQVRYRFLRLLVDEFQDTNELQCALLERIGAGCTFQVGDEWQSIYRFRAADVAVFRRRAAELGERSLGMRDNFRSSPALLDVVNSLFARSFGDSYEHVLVGKRPEAVAASSAGGAARAPRPACELLLVPAERCDAPRAAEAAAVAARVAALLQEGADAGEIALLLGAQTHARTFEQALQDHGIPTVRSTSRGYFGQQQVRDVTALLAWTRNHDDDRAALGVLAAPYIGLQWKDMLRIRRAGTTIMDGLRQDEHPAAQRAVELLGEMDRIAASGTLVDLVEHAVHGSGYAPMVLRMRGGRQRYANLRKLVELAAGAERIGVGDVGRFLELVEAQRSLAVEGEAAIADEAAGCVRIMTIHAAKGLEFPYVFVCDTSNAGNRQQPNLLVDADGVAAWRVPDADGLEWLAPAALEQLWAADRAAADAEQRRLLYVALTRAERQAWVSGVLAKPLRSGERRLTGALGWMLDDLDVDVEAALADGTWSHEQLSLSATIVARAPAPARAQAPAPPPLEFGACVRLPALDPIADEHRDPQDAVEHPPARHRDPGGTAALEDRRATAVTQREARRVGKLVHHRLAQALSRRSGTFSTAVATRLAADMAALIEEVVGSETFQELLRRAARPEVPYCAPLAGGVVEEAGRFDALAIDEASGEWWIVDFKMSLPQDEEQALSTHAEQLDRYAAAAFAAGATRVRLTLLSVEAPGRPVERLVTAAAPAMA